MAKQHISWSIAAGCTGFVVGVWLALYWGVPSFLAFVGLAMLLSGFLYRRTWTLAVVAVGALLLGVVCGSAERGASSQVITLVGQSVSLIGTVREDPSTTGSGQTGLQLNFLRVGGYEVRGSVWASVGTTSDIKRGDRVELRGTAKEGFGNFLFSLPRASVKEVVRPVPGDVGRVVRDWFADAVRLGIAEPQASLGIGFLTGQKSALPEELSEQLRIAGLTHIVVASGYNLTILVRLARRLFKKHSLFLSTASSMAMIIGFIAVTGLSPSMTRAGLVSSLSLLAANYGRSIHPFVLLPFVAAISVAWQPSFVWGDLGWLLSMTAFAGVMIVAPLMQAYFFWPRPARFTSPDFR